MHFHYVSDAIDVTAKAYINGTNHYYPHGSFDFRPMLNLTSKADLSHSRLKNIERLIQTFPDRKYILVGDTSSPGTVKGYAKLAAQSPAQIQCILMRDTAATEPADWIVPATRHFQKLPKNKYLFFRTPSGAVHPTLADLDVQYLRNLTLNGTSATTGCFDYDDPIQSSLHVDGRVGTHLLSLLRWGAWGTVCEFIPKYYRPNFHCRFDRRPGTKYWNGKTEGAHDE